MRELGSRYIVCEGTFKIYRVCVRELGSKYSVCECVCEGTRH